MKVFLVIGVLLSMAYAQAALGNPGSSSSYIRVPPRSEPAPQPQQAPQARPQPQVTPVRPSAPIPAPAPAQWEPQPVAEYDEWGRPNPDAFYWTGVSLGLHAGTLGAGAETTSYITDWLNFRGTAHYLMGGYKTTTGNVDFDYDLSAPGARLMLDFYPTRMKNFRISVGAVVKDMKVTVKGEPKGNARVGDNVYTAEQTGTLRGRASYDTISPYVGIGWGNSVKPDSLLTFSMDIGLMIQGYSFSLSSNGTARGDDQFQQDLRKTQSDVEDNLDWLKVYPVISFGYAYHF